MKSHRFLSHCMSSPWAMEPTAMSLAAALLAKGYAKREGVQIEHDPVIRVGYGVTRTDVAAAVAGTARAADFMPALVAMEDEGPAPVMAAGARATGNRQGSIAVVRVFGTIVQRASQLGPCEGGTGTEDIGAALQSALSDETVSQILIQYDTPGGSVFGVSELGDMIRSARAQKPIVGIADSMAASAGYWLLSQCSEAYCTPGGMVGSIGVYGAHQDISKALENEGVNITLVSAGKYKTEGAPNSPLSDEARGAMQQSIDGYYSMFTSAVAKGRGVPVEQVRTGMGEGRCLSASDALKANMIDGVMTFGDVVKKMARAQQSQQRSGRSAQANRNELDLLSL